MLHENIFGLQVTMSHTIGVQIIKGRGDTVTQLLRTLLTNYKLALLEVGEKIAAVQLLHDNVDIVLVFKDIEQANDVRMLAHLKNFDLTTLQLDILYSHLFL